VKPEILALGLGALPGIFALAASDVVERGRVRARAGVRERSSGGTSLRLGRRAQRIVATVLGLWLGLVVAGLPGAVAGSVWGLIAPAVRARRARARRVHLLREQLADALPVVSVGLRAGLSLLQAIALAADDVGSPLGPTLRELSDRVTLGTPFARSLDRWTDEVGVPEARLLAGVLRLQRRTGGDLPAVLDRLARTLRDRRSVAREVRSLTAQARLSGAILGLLPIGFFLFLSVTSRDDVAAAYHAPAGVAAIGIGLLLQAVAFLWIRHLLRVEA
jgi:tight adherence protein B